MCECQPLICGVASVVVWHVLLRACRLIVVCDAECVVDVKMGLLRAFFGYYCVFFLRTYSLRHVLHWYGVKNNNVQPAVA